MTLQYSENYIQHRFLRVAARSGRGQPVAGSSYLMFDVKKMSLPVILVEATAAARNIQEREEADFVALAPD